MLAGGEDRQALGSAIAAEVLLAFGIFVVYAAFAAPGAVCWQFTWVEEASVTGQSSSCAAVLRFLVCGADVATSDPRAA